MEHIFIYGSFWNIILISQAYHLTFTLLSRGAAVNGTDPVEHGEALGRAAKGGNCDMIQLLLDHGADPNTKWRGYKPYYHANFCRNEAAAVMLKTKKKGWFK